MSWLGVRSCISGILSDGLVAGLKVLLPVATVDTVMIPLLPSNNPSDHPFSRQVGHDLLIISYGDTYWNRTSLDRFAIYRIATLPKYHGAPTKNLTQYFSLQVRCYNV